MLILKRDGEVNVTFHMDTVSIRITSIADLASLTLPIHRSPGAEQPEL